MSNGKMRRPGLDKQIKDTFISKDAGSVGEFIVDDVIIPGLKSMMQKGLHGAIDTIFGTGTGYSKSSYRSSYYDRASYNYGRRERDRDDKHYDSSRYRRRGRKSRGVEVDVDSWQDAEEIRDTLVEIFDRKEVLSVFDLISVLEDHGIDTPDSDYTDNEWGWEDITDIHMSFKPNGRAVISLPRPEYIK